MAAQEQAQVENRVLSLMREAVLLVRMVLHREPQPNPPTVV